MEGTKLFDYRLSIPCNICVIGKSNCGNSSILRTLCEKRDQIFKSNITRVIFVYEGPLDFARNNPEIEFHREIPEIPEDSTDSILTILDDCMTRLSQKDNTLLNNLVTRYTHHIFRGVSIISLQTISPKNFGLASTQTNVLIIFPNQRSC